MTAKDDAQKVREESLRQQAIQVFEDKGESLVWLSNPVRGLDGANPLEYARTKERFKAVRHLLGCLGDGGRA